MYVRMYVCTVYMYVCMYACVYLPITSMLLSMNNNLAVNYTLCLSISIINITLIGYIIEHISRAILFLFLLLLLLFSSSLLFSKKIQDIAERVQNGKRRNV